MPVLSLCVKQYPRVLQGFKLQADALTGHLPRPGSQPVDEAALAIETQHVRIFKKTHTHTKSLPWTQMLVIVIIHYTH